MPDNGEAASIDFLERVLGCVPIAELGIEVDDVRRGNTPPDKRQMVVASHGEILVDENIAVAQSRGG